MADERWSRMRALFAAVDGMADDARREYLDRELADDPTLRAKLDALIAAEISAGRFLSPNSTKTNLGSIGPYRLLEVLGEGGFGVVYLAEAERPIKRRVALKLVRRGMDTQQVLRRFEVERAALALMDHPAIAQVFDAGETPSGRPYFTMEYVPGVPITAFCDERQLPIQERLGLFLQVCDAVQHAHQKGVIHRDLKPSNVLVVTRDETFAPKIIDFGIVKATSESTPGASLMTQEGMIVGTLGYMSPEQAGGAHGVDTRSDIYSLGVMLYELLTGAPPFDSERLQSAALSDAVRVIREEDPPTLAARVADGAPGTAEVAKLRSTDTRHLLRELKGELQWITLRALEKDPNRRYASAAEFAADIRRHLADEPVLASPPSTMYRVRKYARRHRVGVIAAAIVLVTILGGGVATEIGFRRAVQAEHVARREAESSKRVTDFLVELFVTPTPDRSMGQTITARTLLDVGARRIQGDDIQDPSVRARLLSAMGSAYSELGIRSEGLGLLRDAAETTRRASGPRSAAFGEALSELADQMRVAGENNGVDSLTDRSIEVLAHAEGANRNALALALVRKSEWRLASSKLADADSLLRVAIEMLEGEARPDTAVLVRAYAARAWAAEYRFKENDEKRDQLRALELATAHFGERNSHVLALHRYLTIVYSRMGEPDSAMLHADAAVRLARSMFPDGHPTLAMAISGRGDALMGAHRCDEAAAAHEEALAIYRAGGAGEDPMLESEIYMASLCYECAGRLDLAIERMREACALDSKSLGPDHTQTAARLRTLANMTATIGKLNEADSMFVAAIPHLDPLTPHESAGAYTGLANVRRDRGRFADADSLYQRAEALWDTTSAYLRSYYGDCLTQHAYLRSLQGRHAEAESMMRTGVEIQLRGDTEDSPEMLDAFVRWAAARARAGDAKGAMEELRRAVRCGATTKDVARFPALAALSSRPDSPLRAPQ